VPNRASKQDHQGLTYLAVRERLLAMYDENDEVEWLVQVGSFVRFCWLAEENDRDPGIDLDEAKHDHLWNKLTVGGLHDLQKTALFQLDEYAARNFRAYLKGYVRRRIKPIAWLVDGLGWVSMEAWRGFVGGIGLIVLGLLFAWAAPHTVKSIRDALDDILPAAAQQGAPSQK
jgi:hypothetical protein